MSTYASHYYKAQTLVILVYFCDIVRDNNWYVVIFRPTNSLDAGFAPYTLFCLICTIHSKLNCFPILTNLGELGSISAGFQWMGSIPAGFQEGFRAGVEILYTVVILYHIRSQILILQYTKCILWYCTLYGVATVSRIDKIIGLFCTMLSLLWDSFAKETYNFIDPTNCSHPIHYIVQYHNIQFVYCITYIL